MKKVSYRGKEYLYEGVKERENRLKKTALVILEQCESDGLTIDDFNRTLEIARDLMGRYTIMSRCQHD